MPQRNLEGWGPSQGVMGVMDAWGWSLGGSGPGLCLTPTTEVAGGACVCLSVCLTTHLLGLCRQVGGVPPSFPCIAGVLWSPVPGSAHWLGHVPVPSPVPPEPGCCPAIRCMPAAGRSALRDRCTALGRALSLAAPSRADGSRHMHFLTRSIGWERAELSPQVCDQSQTCPGSPTGRWPCAPPLSITWPIYGAFMPAEQVGNLAVSQVAGVLPLHPWRYRDGQCLPALQVVLIPDPSI